MITSLTLPSVAVKSIKCKALRYVWLNYILSAGVIAHKATFVQIQLARSAKEKNIVNGGMHITFIHMLTNSGSKKFEKLTSEMLDS